MVCSAMSSVFVLKDRQRNVLRSVLTSNSSLSNEWKVLVCDSESQTLVDALFENSQLRSFGVTLKTIIDNPRGAVPDAPALYLIGSTPHNVAWLTKDLSKSSPLYNRTSVAFLTSVSPSLLSALAAQVPIPSPITSVCDLHSRFISLEQNLFTLNMKNSFLEMTRAGQDEQSNHSFMEQVVDGLFSVLITLGVIPIIRTQLGGPAEAIGASLDRKLRDNLDIFQRASVSSRALAFRRPLLLLVDRNLDFNPIMYHSWTYQALVHDCLDMKLNRVKVEVPSPAGDKPNTLKAYTLDKQNDFFWDENAFSPFPIVAEAVEAALKKYREDVASINNQGSTTTSETRTEGEGGGASRLVEAISSLPELTRQKETIDMHTNVATTLLNNINNRSLDTYFDLESQLMKERSGAAVSQLHDGYKAPLLELLQPRKDDDTGTKRGEGTAMDRLRLFLMFYDTFGERLGASEMEEYKSLLVSAGADCSAVDYVTKSKGHRHDNVPVSPPSNTGTLNTAKLKGLMKRVVNRGYRSITNVAQSAKNLVMEQTAMFTTARTLEVFIKDSARERDEHFTTNVLEKFALFDPKVLPPSDSMRFSASADNSSKRGSQRKAHHTLFSDAIVFTVGGGNYVEFENCLEAAGRGVPVGAEPNVLYGTTEMVTAESFISQMCGAHKEIEESEGKHANKH